MFSAQSALASVENGDSYLFRQCGIASRRVEICGLIRRLFAASVMTEREWLFIGALVFITALMHEAGERAVQSTFRTVLVLALVAWCARYLYTKFRR